jgi:hypothetical protein
MKFKEFYLQESEFTEKNKENKEREDVDELKQKISKLFDEGKSLSDIESELKVRLVFPKEFNIGEPPNKIEDVSDKYIISKTYDIVKESEEYITESEGKNGYKAFYKGKSIEVHANSSYEAQKIAAERFKAKKSYEVHVVLAEKDGKEVTHSTTEI